MTEDWKVTNMFTGQAEALPDNRAFGEPPQAWLDGWEAYMRGDPKENPYDQGTGEWWDWQDGWEAAERD